MFVLQATLLVVPLNLNGDNRLYDYKYSNLNIQVYVFSHLHSSVISALLLSFRWWTMSTSSSCTPTAATAATATTTPSSCTTLSTRLDANLSMQSWNMGYGQLMANSSHLTYCQRTFSLFNFWTINFSI